VRYRCYDHNIEYKPGDCVFIESQRADQPFYICFITEFKRSKRDNLMVGIRWFYRTTEVPETVYNFLIKDRYTEHGEAAIHDPLIKSRELFTSNATDQFPVNVLRGKCEVKHCADIVAVKQFEPKDDAFFYTLR
jgi:arginine-glutamic acid dipeptide repeat-containing protein